MPPYKIVDRQAPEIIAVLAASPLYRKPGYFQARYAKLREKVPLLLADGKTESFVLARRGDWVVLSAAGDSELVNGDKFRLEYEKIEDGGVYVSKAFVKAAPNPYGVAIEIQSERGFPQKGGKDCFFVDACTAAGGLAGDVYLLSSYIFARTYARYDEK